jgi:hypothetical protein
MGKRIVSPLDQADMDVPPDPSAGNTTGADTADPTPEGDISGDSPSGTRTVENVRGELLRKMQADNAALRNDILTEIRGMVARQPEAAPAPTTDVNQMSAAQLEALRPSVPDANHAELDRLIAKRRIDEAVAQGIDQRLSARDVEQARQTANSNAFSRWPELRDTGSTFRQVTNEVLKEMGSASNNPRAVLDAANEAGLRLGLRPVHSLMSAGGASAYSQRTARGNGGEPAPVAESFAMTDAEAANIAKKLQRAMPKGKFTPEQLKRAQKRSGDYREHQDLFIKK